MLFASLVLYGLCPGCGLVFDLLRCCLSGGSCFGLMPFPLFFREGDVRFSIFSCAVWLLVIFGCFGLCPFGNKFLLIQKKKIPLYYLYDMCTCRDIRPKTIIIENYYIHNRIQLLYTYFTVKQVFGAVIGD